MIIIHSEGSRLTYQNKKVVKMASTPEGDIFKTAFSHIISKYSAEESEHSRFLNARFSYSPQECIITDIFGQSNNYVLMNHIHHLVAIIHNIPIHSPEGSLCTEILHHDSYHKVEQGKDLQAKIDQASKFLIDNPDHFDRNDSGLSMTSFRSNSNNSTNSIESANLNKIHVEPSSPGSTTHSDIFGHLESPDNSLTEFKDLLRVRIQPSVSDPGINQDMQDELDFFPPEVDSDSDASLQSTEYARQLNEINHDTLTH